MKGADEYADLFRTGQYGRFYITSGSHARGATFHIQILPDMEEAVPNGPNMCLNKEAVEVYGITSGNPGWTEKYGWLYTGPWVSDFDALVAEKRAKLKAIEVEEKAYNDSKAREEYERKMKLLREY